MNMEIEEDEQSTLEEFGEEKLDEQDDKDEEYYEEEPLNDDDLKTFAKEKKDHVDPEYYDESTGGLFSNVAEDAIQKQEPVEEENNIEQEPISVDRKMEFSKHSKEVIRMFDKTEISEINQYVSTSVPFSQLNQFFLLSERPLIKAQIYTGVYRIIQSVSRYVAAEKTRKNIQKLLDETKDVYPQMYNVLVRYQNAPVNFNKHRLLRKIENFFLDSDVNSKTNKLVDAFLVFVEKQELMDLDRITGLDLDNAEGQRAYKDINVDSMNIRE